MTKPVSYANWSLEPYCIGLKLRSLRMQKRLTLARLAAETGLSTALLSKLETDRMIPTLPTLATISRVYGVGVGYFFNEPSRHVLAITRRAHLESNSRGQDPVKMVPLNPGDSRLLAQMVELQPGAASMAMQPIGETVGVLYVLAGRLLLNAGGKEEFLETGDCVCIDTHMTMAWSAADKHPCRVLAVMAPAQEKATD